MVEMVFIQKLKVRARTTAAAAAEERTQEAPELQADRVVEAPAVTTQMQALTEQMVWVVAVVVAVTHLEHQAVVAAA
jgi:hypothetical protein